ELEQMLRRRAAVDDLGVQVVDADAALGEMTRQIADDAWPVDAGKFQRNDPASRWRGRRLALRDHDPQARRFESAQRLRERLGVLRRHVEVNDAGELAGEIRHPAPGPVRAEPLRALR